MTNLVIGRMQPAFAPTVFAMFAILQGLCSWYYRHVILKFKMVSANALIRLNAFRMYPTLFARPQILRIIRLKRCQKKTKK